MQARPERISSLNVERGLYVLRYLPAAGNDHPTIFIRPSPGDESGLTFIPFPGEPADRLAAPGSLVVVLVPQPATMHVTARAASATGSLHAELRLDPLKPGASLDATRQSAPLAAPQSPAVTMRAPVATSPAAVDAPATDTLRLRAHIAYRGNVLAPAGAWIGGPDAPSPIEGLAVDCPAALGDVVCQVMVAGEQRWSDWLTRGTFGGSRGRATPLTGLRLRFLPAPGVEATLDAEALFLGSAIIRRQGNDIELRSAAGSDPLLGVRLTLWQRTTAPAPRADILPQPPIPPVPPGGRVRVFRASGRRASDS